MCSVIMGHSSMIIIALNEHGNYVKQISTWSTQPLRLAYQFQELTNKGHSITS